MPHQPWEHLLESLNSWAVARSVPGGIEVTFSSPSSGRRVVEIVMTPEDWEEMADVIGSESPETVQRHLLALDASEHFLVSDSGVELLPSATRELPPNPSDDFVPGQGGQWVATDAAGNVLSRLADGDDEQP